MIPLPRRRGYVLLVTLGLLVLSAALLVSVARSAVRHAAEARLEEQRVQRRWAIASARAAVLPYAEQILVTAERSQNTAMPRYTADVRLGPLTMTLTVADEQAKANVNELLRTNAVDEVEDRLRRGLSGTRAIGHLRLRPAPAELTRPLTGEDPANVLPPVSGFGQLFDTVDPAVLWPAAGPSPLDSITLWGEGGLNLMRADRSAMRLALTPALTTVQIDRLIQSRDADQAGPRPGQSPQAARAPDAIGRLLERAGVPPVGRAGWRWCRGRHVIPC